MGTRLSIEAVEEMLVPQIGIRITPVSFATLFCGLILVLKLIYQEIILSVIKRNSKHSNIEEGIESNHHDISQNSSFQLVNKMQQQDRNFIQNFLIVFIPYLIYSQSSYFNYHYSEVDKKVYWSILGLVNSICGSVFICLFTILRVVHSIILSKFPRMDNSISIASHLVTILFVLYAICVAFAYHYSFY